MAIKQKYNNAGNLRGEEGKTKVQVMMNASTYARNSLKRRKPEEGRCKDKKMIDHNNNDNLGRKRKE